MGEEKDGPEGERDLTAERQVIPPEVVAAELGISVEEYENGIRKRREKDAIRADQLRREREIAEKRDADAANALRAAMHDVGDETGQDLDVAQGLIREPQYSGAAQVGRTSLVSEEKTTGGVFARLRELVGRRKK